MSARHPIRAGLPALIVFALAVAVFLCPSPAQAYNRPSWVRIEASESQITVRFGWRVNATETNRPDFQAGQALELTVSANPEDYFVIPALMPDVDPSLGDQTAQSDLPCAYRDIYNHSAADGGCSRICGDRPPGACMNGQCALANTCTIPLRECQVYGETHLICTAVPTFCGSCTTACPTANYTCENGMCCLDGVGCSAPGPR